MIILKENNVYVRFFGDRLGKYLFVILDSTWRKETRWAECSGSSLWQKLSILVAPRGGELLNSNEVRRRTLQRMCGKTWSEKCQIWCNYRLLVVRYNFVLCVNEGANVMAWNLWHYWSYERVLFVQYTSMINMAGIWRTSLSLMAEWEWSRLRSNSRLRGESICRVFVHNWWV